MDELLSMIIFVGKSNSEDTRMSGESDTQPVAIYI